MGKTNNKILVITLILISAVSAQADITIFDSNATISAGDSYDTIVVKGDGTVVDMTGGNVNDVITMNASTFNMSGGTVANSALFYDSSKVNQSGGYLIYGRTYGKNQITISGDASGEALLLYGPPVITISSNNVVFDHIYIGQGSSIANISGGTFNQVEIGESANVSISGGTITLLLAWSDNHLENKVKIVGYNLDAVPYGGSLGEGQITGFWNDKTSFTMNLREWSYASIALYDGVAPPKCTNKPESDLSGDCMVNFIDLAKLTAEWLDCGLEPQSACQE